MSSRAIEDYLKAVYAITSEGQPATTGLIAQRVGVSQPSATNMVKRLARRGLVRHTPYRAVELTAAGTRQAQGVVRRHRLLELYLEKMLGVELDHVHDEAERLEHALSDELEDRLDELLGHPSTDPHGEPIPPHAAPGRRLVHHGHE